MWNNLFLGLITFSIDRNKGGVLIFLLVILGLTLALIKMFTAFVISKLHLRDANKILYKDF